MEYAEIRVIVQICAYPGTEYFRMYKPVFISEL